MPRGFVLAGLACLALAIAGCQKNAGNAASAAPSATSAAVNAAPAPAAAVAANLPPECQALLAALQACLDHLAASHSPVAAQFKAALEQSRETLPAAVNDPGLPAQCADSLRQQQSTAHDLGC